MLASIRRKSARLLGCAAIGTILVSVSLLALAYFIPDRYGESRGIARWLFAVAFFTRTFEMHLGLALLLPLALLLWARGWRTACVAGSIVAWFLAPLIFSYVRSHDDLQSPPLRVMTANLLIGHAEVDALAEEVQRFSPDVLFLQEYTPAKAAALALALKDLYPHRVEGMRDHAFGEAIYSKIPFATEPELYPHASIRGQGRLDGREGGEVGIWDAQIRAVINFHGTQIVLQNVHYAPPIRPAYLREQRIMTKWLCDWLRTEARPVIIAGDFNCTQSSVNLRDLERAGATNSRVASRGWAGTWPARGLPSLMPVAIDHILVRGLKCRFSAPGSDIDSDHLPLTAIVGVR